MALTPGTRIGAYEVVATLGRGGMGEVYRARDSKLHREVALKVLPESFAADSDRLARFQREARVLASLNHPHIGAIYGLEDSGGAPTLVLELVEGPTLADRIARGPVAMPEAIAIARQIAQALDTAHEQGIVHRDLKPSNIKIKDDGTVKVLDFGLAKAMTEDTIPTSEDVTQSPTITSPVVTSVGVLLGTAGYMSPESVRGRPADKRADIWAFGCVLFEMLAGKPAFGGQDTAELLGAIVHIEPDWNALPRTVPPAVVSVLKRCLQKDRKLRARDIADVQALLDDALTTPAAAAVQPAVVKRPRSAVAGWIAAGTVAIAAGLFVISRGTSTIDAPETRLEITTPLPSSQFSIAVSPDGRSIVFAAFDGDQPRLWLRPLHAEQARPLSGTDSAVQPFWSPDGQSIGFFADEQLKRLDLANGAVRVLASAPQSRGGAWNREGVIVFGAGSTGTLFRVAADGGGTVSPATTLLPGQTNHRFPHLLPDGRQFLFMTLGLADVRGVYRASLDDATPRRVMERDAAFALLSPEHVLVARQGGLWARRLNPADASLSGDYMLVARKVLVDGTATGNGVFSASPSGTIAYRTSAGNLQLVWLDRSGARVGTVGEANDSQQALRYLAHDGRSVGVVRSTDANQDVWLIDTARGTSQRFTTDPGTDGEPVLSHDGNSVVYSMDARADVYQIVRQRSDGTGPVELLYESGQNKNPVDWSSDGKYVLFLNQGADTGWDLLALPLSSDRKPIDVARSKFTEGSGRFSPDGKWVAFGSAESGRSEVFVQAFPNAGRKQPISVGGGGASPRWRRDGRELYYLTGSDRLMAVSVTSNGASLDISTPRYLFTLPPRGTGYEPSADGQKFLVNAVVSNPSPISVILNWKPPK